MGAETIIKIIEDSIDKAKQVKQLILQPQSKLSFFRKKMNEFGFLCKNETLLLDDKFYHVFSYYYQKDLLPISEREINIGFISLKKNPQLYLQWVKENILKLEPISKQSTENYVLYQYFNQELLSNQFLDMDVD
ncbi:MAG: SAM-dependent methyltransferase [Erysipelothrix sp.]|nr:SAM-dependent methyltransferase [Erysipelothrix sp.]